MCYSQSGTLLKWGGGAGGLNWIHVLCATSCFKNELPCVSVSQNAHRNREPTVWDALRRDTETPTSLSLPRQSSAAGLFVRLFTSLLMSTWIKMSAQSEGSEAQSPPPHIIKSEQKKKTNPVYNSCVCVRAFVCIWSGFWNERGQFWGLNFHSSSVFHTTLSHCRKLQKTLAWN